MSTFAEGATPRVLFAADVNGTLHGFSRTGARLLTFATEHEGVITAIAFGSREEPFVATASSDGNVIVHNISASREIRTGRAAAPPKARRKQPPPAGGGVASGSAQPDGAEGPPPPPPPPTIALTVDRVIPLEPGGDLSGSSPEVTALEVYSRGRRSVLLAGDSAGVFRMVLRNGTLVRTLRVGEGGGVSASARLGTVLAYATTDGSVGLIDLHRFSVLRTCELPALPAAAGAGADGGAAAGAAGRSAALSLAFDVHLSQLLYVGTADGMTHVFNTRARRRDPSAEAALKRGTARQQQQQTQALTTCTHVSSWSTHAPAHGGVRVVASKGYVFGASAPAPPAATPRGRRGAGASTGGGDGGARGAGPRVLSVTNVSALYGHSKGDPRLTLSVPLGAAEAEAGAGHGQAAAKPDAQFQWSASSAVPPRVLLALGARALAVAGGGNSTELRLYEHRFEYAEPSKGFNMRGPMVVTALVLTVGYQLWKKWSTERAQSDGSARGAGGGLANRRAADLAALDREMEQLRSLGAEGLLGEMDRTAGGGGRGALRGAGSSRRAGNSSFSPSSASGLGEIRAERAGASRSRHSEATRRAKFDEILDDDYDDDDDHNDVMDDDYEY